MSDKKKPNTYDDTLIGDGYDLLTMEIPPVEWYVPHIIAKNQQTLFAGDSEGGKSTWLLYNAVCIASGTNTIMGDTEQANVLFIDEEMGKQGLARKVQQICEPLDIKPIDLKGKFFYRTIQGFKFDGEHVENIFLSYKSNYDIKVIIVDSLIATSKGDPNTMDMRRLRDFLRLGYTYDISIVFNHHTNKIGTGKGKVNSKSMYGSIDITNAFDNTYGISRFDSKIKIEHIKARYLAPEDKINLNIPFKNMSYSKPYQTSGYQYIEAILNLFKISNESQLRYKDFQTALVRKNPKIENGFMSEFSLQKYLKVCQEQKLICKNAGGFYELF